MTPGAIDIPLCHPPPREGRALPLSWESPPLMKTWGDLVRFPAHKVFSRQWEWLCLSREQCPWRASCQVCRHVPPWVWVCRWRAAGGPSWVKCCGAQLRQPAHPGSGRNRLRARQDFRGGESRQDQTPFALFWYLLTPLSILNNCFPNLMLEAKM